MNESTSDQIAKLAENFRKAEAADELLEALEALLDEFEHVARKDPHMAEQGYGSEILPVVFGKAHAAIAKAKGE